MMPLEDTGLSWFSSYFWKMASSGVCCWARVRLADGDTEAVMRWWLGRRLSIYYIPSLSIVVDLFVNLCTVRIG
jgi:hypothetical protein